MKISNKVRHLLNFIGNIEAPQGYQTIYGNNQRHLKKPITSMTLNEILRVQTTWSKAYGSSATGRYQFMKRTLEGLKNELRMSGAEIFTAELQDKLAYHLLKRRGYGMYMSGTIDRIEFGKRLAKEWASLPVLQNTKGAHRQIKRGQSYYSGDRLNKSLVKAGQVEKILTELKDETVDIPVETKKKKYVAQGGLVTIISFILYVVLKFFGVV